MKTNNTTSEYLNIVKIYEDKYKSDSLNNDVKFIVLYQVGTFFEMYSAIENDPRLVEVTTILNIILSKSNKNIENVSKSNPAMAGIPIHTLNKYLKLLIDNNYIVITYIQSPDNIKKRILNKIYTSSSYIEDETINHNNNLFSIYIETFKQEIFIGISIINTITGEVSITELYNNDINKIIEDIHKLLIIFKAKEFIINISKDETIENKITNNLINKTINKINNSINQLTNNYNTKPNVFIKYLIKENININYQIQFLNKIYENKVENANYLLESFNIDRNEFARISLVSALEYIYNCDNTIIKYLDKPKKIINEEYLNLHNNALYQLNVLSTSNKENTNSRISTRINSNKDSLFSIINKTLTILGERYLKYNLTYPITNISELNLRYNLIDFLIADSNNLNEDLNSDLNNNVKYTLNSKCILLKIRNNLSGILDITKYHRLLSLTKLMPYQYGKLNKSYNLIIKVINNSKVVFKNNKLLNDKFNYDKLLLFKKYYDKYINYFNITNLESYSYNSNLNNIISNTLEKIGKDIKNNAKDDIKDTIKNNNYLKCFNIFNQGIISEIDDIENEIIDNVHKLYELTNIFSNIVNSREKGGDNLNNFLNSKSKIKLFNIKYTDRDGYYISSTNTRALKLKKIIQEEYEVINNSLNNSLNNCIIGELSYIKKTQSSTYITSNYIKNISNELIKLEDKLNNLIKQKYLEIIMKLYIEFKDILIYVKKFIEFIDFITNLSYISIKYNYNKPEIENNKLSKQSFISSEQIRHPIVEQIMDDVIYVTNNIDINLDKTGALIYGINGSGKSTIMKSIGLNLILAQIGCYTASKTFKYYPYTNLFTRIDHSDNLFKGLSSFESEIIELKTILKYANSNSLVLGDEILNSTENISAISLISASINHFINNNISFIFASHLHQIPESINKDIIDKLYIGHLKSDFDSKTQLFIYNRKLNAGMSILNYGLLVAKSLLDESSIINDALDIQNKILNKENNSLGSKILENKKSVYNSKLYMNECYICKDLGLPKYDNQILDTHHINEQNTFKKNGLTEICIDENLAYIKKNNRYNLVNLCKLHHIKIHNNQITINGWIKTTNGRKLDYTIIN